MEKARFENREEIPFTTRTVGGSALMEIIYKGESLPQDNRFLPVEKGGVFKYFELGGLADARQNIGNKFYSIAEAENEIAGLAELEVDPYKDKNFWIKFISVDPNYQGHGCASKLAEEIFEFAKRRGYSLEESFYSEEGEEKIKHLIRELAERLSVRLVEHK